MNVKMDDDQFDDLAIEYDMTSSPARKAKLKQRLINILDKDPEMLCATKALIFDPDFKVYENQMKLNILADCDDFDLEMAENRIDKDDKTQKDTIQNRINGDGYEAGQCDGDLFQKIKEWDGKIMTGVKTAIIVSAMYLGIAGVPGVKGTNLSLLENIAIAGECSTAKCYIEQGETKYGQDNKKGALKDFKKALRLNPKSSSAYNNIGYVQMMNKDYTSARKNYQKAIDFDPNNPDAHTNMGLLNFYTGNKQGAIKKFRDALRINPSHSNANQSLDYLLNN